jgi:large subunit ribosomal protein L29
MILKVKDLINKTDTELNEELNSLKDKLFETRMSFHARKLENTNAMRQLKKSIARILTIVRSREGK